MKKPLMSYEDFFPNCNPALTLILPQNVSLIHN
uniref:Uncharacterized protein n=1 Tax=Anguilla anguilla TaxID=7936 RepID=A0A0E9X9G9_ANGAN